MSEDPRVDDAGLAETFSTAAGHARRREVETVEALLGRAQAQLRDQPLKPDRREQLAFGCERVEQLVADEPLVAAAYLDAMAERVAEES